jgi:Interferon-induced transmembrane protein
VCTFELVLFQWQEAQVTEPTTPTQQPSPAPAPGPPSANAGWAVASLLFFWPLSFSAFSHAFDVYPLWASGNLAGAQYASDRVRRLGQLSLWIFGGLLLLFAVLYAIFLVVLISQGDGMFYHHRYRG